MNKVKLELKGFLTFLILHELSKEELCGEDLANKIGARKHQDDMLTPGTIYPAIKKLRLNKMLKLRQDGRKKFYKLNKKGKEQYKLLHKDFKRYFKGL